MFSLEFGKNWHRIGNGGRDEVSPLPSIRLDIIIFLKMHLQKVVKITDNIEVSTQDA